MKSSVGNFFEDFHLYQHFLHQTERVLTVGDAAVYKAIYGSRFDNDGLDELLLFHTVFGLSVGDVSLNAVANLGYAECRIGTQTRFGEDIRASSDVIGLKPNSDGKTGIVYVRTEGTGVSYARWVMVRKRDANAEPPETVVPEFAKIVAPETLVAPTAPRAFPDHMWRDYAIGEKIDHIDGTTVEEAEHAMATRLYHNTARVHFNQFAEKDGRFGRRLVYGGHVLSVARALSYNGLQGAFRILAINGGRHVNPVFAGDTIFAWSQVLDKAESKDPHSGLLRLRLVATKNLPCGEFPESGENVVLDFDLWAAIAR